MLAQQLARRLLTAFIAYSSDRERAFHSIVNAE
jgi:hypothetical protein